MARLVMKFGGTSVADLDRIRAVALRVKSEVDAGHHVAVVVSAMAGQTNQLVEWCREACPLHDTREYDAVVSSGEQVTAGLLALALQNIEVAARSWMGWQLGVETSDTHGAARIQQINPDGIEQRWQDNVHAVVAGFQGLGPDKRITTLGRGGSDTSAVALAAALNAERCDIYTDVPGIFTADPRIVPEARKIDKISYEEMLELASQGAKVLQTRSVELAYVHGVRMQVRSSFTDEPGTLVCDEDEIVETEVVSGIAYSKDEAKVTLTHVADLPGVAAKIFGPLGDALVNVDMIVQNVSEDGKRTDMTFTVPCAELGRAIDVVEREKASIGFGRIIQDTNVSKVSVVGIGMRSHTGVAKTMFEALAAKGINIQVISTSEIKISVLVAAEYTELAVRALHAAYGLDQA